MKNLQGMLVLMLLIINTIIWFIPLILFAMIRAFSPGVYLKRLFTKLPSKMASFWISCNSFIFTTINKTHWNVSGIDHLNEKDWYLLLVNHLSWVDVIVLQTIFNGRIPFLKFFIKRELVWLPFLGLSWWALDMQFMKRYSKEFLEKNPSKKGQDVEATKKACRKFRNVPTSVINFVEGTRFTESKKLTTKSPYHNLLKPKAGGIAMAISAMGDMFDKILDVTIVYPKGVVSFWDMLCGKFDAVAIDVEKKPIEEWMITGDYDNSIEDRMRFQLWLSELWEVKEAKITKMKSCYLLSNNTLSLE